MNTYNMPINDVLTFSILSIRDALSITYPVKNSRTHLEAAIDWLCLAQDSTKDNGVSAYYSLAGWAPSFIETTGYIIETFLTADNIFPEKKLAERAKSMGDFIISMQLPKGGYRTYTPEHSPISGPTIFNTGQDILGMVSLYKKFKIKKYIESAEKAAAFLCKVQNSDGSWSSFEVDSQSHTYHSRVAYAVMEVGNILKKEQFILAARKNLEWVVAQQVSTGWFKKSTLPGLHEEQPITHTIVYTLEGLFYAGILDNNKAYFKAAVMGIEALRVRFNQSKQLYATYDENWMTSSKYVCLTGNAQIAVLWFELYNITKSKKYLDAALKMNSIIKKYQDTSTPISAYTGGIKGCHPVYGSLLENKGYCRCSFINWGTKFFSDALLQELNVRPQ